MRKPEDSFAIEELTADSVLPKDRRVFRALTFVLIRICHFSM
jgi:hypothetical protein